MGIFMTGQEFVKMLRPIGCVVFLAMFAAFLFICFSSGNNEIEGYEPPETSAYYEEHMDELADEIEDNMLPGKVDCRVLGDKIEITLSEQEFFKLRSKILNYYDEDLFEFRKD